MRFLSIRQLRSSSTKLRQQLGKKDLVVSTSNGKLVALLSAADEESLELEVPAWRRARAMVALDELYRRSLEKGTHRLTEREIEEEIRAVRRERTASR